MKIYKTKLYKIDYENCKDGGKGFDHFSGKYLLEHPDYLQNAIKCGAKITIRK